MRVRATGSSGVTTVNAVQTTVKGEGVRNEEMTRGRRSMAVTDGMKRIKCTQRHGQKKEERDKKGIMKAEDWGGCGGDRAGNN